MLYDRQTCFIRINTRGRAPNPRSRGRWMDSKCRSFYSHHVASGFQKLPKSRYPFYLVTYPTATYNTSYIHTVYMNSMSGDLSVFLSLSLSLSLYVSLSHTHTHTHTHTFLSRLRPLVSSLTHCILLPSAGSIASLSSV